MIKIRWELEEAAVLLELYIKVGFPVHSKNNAEIEKTSLMLKKRGIILGIIADNKFRNISGINMQLANLHYVVTEGKEGLSGASKLLYDVYELFKNNKSVYDEIVEKFYNKYVNN